MFRALIVVNRAVVTSESGSTLAFKVGEVVDAVSAVLAPIRFLRAEWDLCLAVLTLHDSSVIKAEVALTIVKMNLKSVGTSATIGTDFIYARGIVDTLVI